MAVARSLSLESMENTQTDDSERNDSPLSGVSTASEIDRSFNWGDLLTVASPNSSFSFESISSVHGARTAIEISGDTSRTAIMDTSSRDYSYSATHFELTALTLPPPPHETSQHNWPRDVIVALAGAAGSDVLEIHRVLGEAIDRTCGWGENAVEKKNRVAKLRADNEKNRSSGRRFSRACRVCLVSDPRERVAFAACGHASCRACADCLPRCDADAARVNCPLCGARTYYVRLFELPKSAAGAQLVDEQATI